MAELFPDEGLDALLTVFPKNGANYANLWAGLFTSQTASAVMSRTGTLSACIVEPAGGAYTRMPVAASGWGAPSTSGNGRKVTNAQITFPTATAPWGTVNGFFLGSASVAGVCVYQANFDDNTGNNVGVNDQQKVTPSMQFDG